MKVVIADSNDIIRVGLNTILTSEIGVQIAGEVVNANELIMLLEKTQVDVIIIDYTQEAFTIDIIPKILSIQKGVKVIAVTPEQTPNVIIEALKSGVTSYVKKDCDLGEIKDSVKETVLGNRFFCGKILDVIRRASIDVEHLDMVNYSCAPVSISEREMEIIKYIAEGSTNIEIAELLHLSPHTVNTHRKNVMTKLGVKNTAGIVMYAVKSNLVSPNTFLFSAGE
ncbi:MAG TPA: response regulator transcription factor [Brumimicrobium sp.]|nr:response regulator transcription factor [Brumimicrobium sp.]